MALVHGYGIVAGTRQSYYRDPVNNYGQYYHANLMVGTPSGTYHCAIDVDSHSVPNGVQWRVVKLKPAMLKGVDALADGWHPLASNATSGALDYIRNPDLRRRWCRWWPGPLHRFNLQLPFVRWPLCNIPWKSGVSTDALADLEPLIAQAQRVFVFGEPFHDGNLGVHNIHQNQGDPIGSDFSASNAIWQDGGTILQLPDGSYWAFCNKFQTQSDHTDNTGRPLP
ncbi:DUF2278 family protein [Arthrobacter sp. 35W]|uniref:DUF2278 family protein n=1 Tax=Arthrobacter sp. 35W TaxID=1132441 RepID=UPI0004791470|nr:DUF2278 family protein [Arthrobacter sp. 35W]